MFHIDLKYGWIFELVCEAYYGAFKDECLSIWFYKDSNNDFFFECFLLDLDVW